MPDTFTVDLTADDQKLLAQVVDFYHQTLKESADALAYLHQRGVTSAQAVDHFRLGYANRTLGTVLPSKDTQLGRDIRGRLQRLGLFRTSGHEQFAGCVVFPVPAADATNRIVDLYGRKTGMQLRKGTPLDMFVGNQRQGVWNIEAVAASEEIGRRPGMRLCSCSASGWYRWHLWLGWLDGNVCLQLSEHVG